MKKKSYEKPVMRAERFVANDYCKMCVELACTIAPSEAGSEVGYNKAHSDDAGHTKKADGSGCGWEKNQVLRVDASGKVSIVEINSGYGGELACTPTNIIEANLNENYIKSQVQNGGLYLEWTTYGCYYHVGTITALDTSRPNHS